MYQNNFNSDCFIRTCEDPNPFSARYDFIPSPEPEINIEPYNDETGEIDPIMEHKLEINENRPVKGKGKKKTKKKPKRLPGEKLMKKIYKEEQLQQSLSRVVKNLIQ